VEVDQIAKKTASVSFTEAELILLNNALNEVLNGLDVSSFDTRLGTPRHEAKLLLHQINLLLSKMK
jgi:hypothetical protein